MDIKGKEKVPAARFERCRCGKKRELGRKREDENSAKESKIKFHR